jgi:uncharacterized protein (DUF433 family)
VEIFPGISSEPDVRFGKPCIAGTRIDAATVVGLIAAGESADTLAAEYQLSIEQVRAALLRRARPRLRASMKPLRARVEKGRLILNEPTTLT